MKSTVRQQQRQRYGRPRLIDRRYDILMSTFLASGKKQVEYWAENLKKESSQPFMTYDTFKSRLRDYLRRTNQVLTAPQLERIRLPEELMQRYALLYLDVSAVVINKAQFFEQYIIVPPYDEVPSYEQFIKKLDPVIKRLQENRSMESAQVCSSNLSINDTEMQFISVPGFNHHLPTVIESG